MIEDEMIHGKIRLNRQRRPPIASERTTIVCAKDEMSDPGIRFRPERRPRIELDTPIIPYAVARGVWEETSAWLQEELPASWVGQLTERANAIYACNPRFRSLIRRKGNAGRDWLWAFTRHWMAGLLSGHHRDLYSRLPSSYTVGRELPRC